MARSTFSFTLYDKYWAAQYKDPAFMQNLIDTILKENGIDATKINIERLLQPERVLVTVDNATSTFTDLNHQFITSRLGIAS